MLTTGPNLGLLDNGAFGERVYHETLRLYRALDGLVKARVKSMFATCQSSRGRFLHYPCRCDRRLGSIGR